MFKNIFSAFSSVRSPQKVDPGQLLKDATAKKDNGDIDGAIALLRESFLLIESESTIYPVETFLRLPLYLQAAGKADEAWKEFNNLLVKGYPNQMKDPKVLVMDHSRIYDKMRLFLTREKKCARAVAMGVCSFLSWAVGLRLQERNEEFVRLSEKNAIDEEVAKLLKKSASSEKRAQLVEYIDQKLKLVPSLNMAEVIRDVEKILS